MYGLPEDFDISTFVNKKIIQICFSANTISLSFDEDISITIMDSFIHMEGADVTAKKQTLPVSSSNLMCIVGKVVCHAEGSKEGKLALQFDNGHSLVLIDDSREYESYIVRIGNKEIIV